MTFSKSQTNHKEKPMKRGILFACLIGLMAAVGVRAADEPSANPPEGHRSMRGGMDGLLPQRLLGKLDLTAEQKTKYDTLNASFKKDVAKLESSHSSGSEGSSTNSAPSSSNASSNRKGIRELHKKYMDQFRPSLTSEQITTLDKAMENMHNNRGSHSGTNSTPKPSTPPPDNT
jgi:Spy/CpxP family protein refolding chaperone